MKYSEILSKMKPEHAAVVRQEVEDAMAQVAKAKEDLNAANTTISEQTTQLTEANEALAKAKEDLANVNEELETLKAKGSEMCECDGEEDEDGMCKACGKPKKKSAGFDETEVLKSMPEGIRQTFLKMREQKEAAEEMVRKNAEEKAEAEAVAKAATLKSLPVAQDTLVEVLKSADQKVVDILTAAATAIDEAVLGEVGKSRTNGSQTTGDDAWSKIEAEADKVAKRDNVSKQKAVSIVIKEQPELYKSYLEGGTE